jgi:hypothetical protein
MGSASKEFKSSSAKMAGDPVLTTGRATEDLIQALTTRHLKKMHEEHTIYSETLVRQDHSSWSVGLQESKSSSYSPITSQEA